MDDPRQEYLDDMRDEERVAALEADEVLPDPDPFWDLPINPITGQDYWDRTREWDDDPTLPRDCEE